MLVRVAAVPAALLLLAAAPEDELRHVPQEGALLTRTWSEETELSIDEMSITVQFEGGEMTIAGDDAALVIGRRVSADEEVLSVEDGEVRELSRTFMELAGTTVVRAEGEEVEVLSGSGLEVETVLFSRAEPGADFEARFEPEGADARLLDGLHALADAAVLLPSGPVEPGDTWEVDAAVLGRVLAPFGDLVLLPEDWEGERNFVDLASVAAAATSALGDAPTAWSGTVAASYEGVREEDGARLAAISLSVDARGESDRVRRAARAAEEMDADFEIDRFAVEVELDAEGTLLFDLEAGRIRSLALTGDLEVTGEIAWHGVYFGMEGSRGEGFYEASGSTRIETAVE